MGHSIAIIGVGPRGVYAIDFLTRMLSAYPLEERVDVHLVEPCEFGPGAVYRTTQPEYLLMNTIASQVTAFADERLGPLDPFEPGPAMHAWLQETGVTFGPDEYPSRAAHGRYLAAAFKAIWERAVPRVRLHQWNCRAVDVQTVDGRHRITLEEGFAPIVADVILLNTGHSTHASAMHDELAAFAAEQRRRGHQKTQFLPSIYPVERNIETLGPDVCLGILGLGLTAIDGITAATIGKGGRFERDPQGQLVYHPSGAEPRIVSWSLPGLPPSARAHNQKGATFRQPAQFLTRARIDALRTAALEQTGTRQLDFQRDIFPLLLLDMEYVYYTTLCGQAFGARYLACAEDSAARTQLIAEVPPASRYSWDHLADPLAGRSFASRSEYTQFLKDFIREELAEASLGNVGGPYKAATDVLRDLRGNVRYAVEFGGLTAESQCWLDRVFWPLHNRIAAGPPASRIEELLALMEAGILDLSFGPAPSLTQCPERGCFRLTTQAFPSEPCDIDVLIDGRIAQPNVRTDKSQLLKRLLGRGVIRPFTNTTGGRTYVPCGIDITEDNHVVGTDGRVNDTIYAMGILCEGTQLYTFVAAAPGVGAKPLIEARNWAFQVRDHLRQIEEGRALTASGIDQDPPIPHQGHGAANRRRRTRRPATPTQLQ
jgi:uncharacterized NAD(P)/FAD-binding protein YdhS